VGQTLSSLRAPQSHIEQHHRSAVWRDAGPLADLRRWRRERPEGLAFLQYGDGRETARITYAEYAARVERFAAAFTELGVGPGDVVAVQLPNIWQVAAVMLAGARIGAVIAPIRSAIRPPELERMLARLGAVVCVTVDNWAGFEHAAALAELAPRLPALRHRVVIGKSAGDEIDFGEFFERTPWEDRHRTALDDAVEDPDRLALVLFTPGAPGEPGEPGEPKGVLHSFNTLHAGVAPIAEAEGIGPADVMFIPHALTFIGGTLYGIAMPLLTGSTSVLLDAWDTDGGLRLLAETGVTAMFAAPRFFADLLAADDRTPTPLPRLRLAVTGATTVPPILVREVPSRLGVTLRTLWGRTEVAAQTWTRADQPVDWGTHSDGSPGPGLEIELRGGQPAHLFVRGAGVCLATMNLGDGRLTVTAEHGDGWYETGELAVPDGDGGIRIVGRAEPV
jgi:cyclohexanecarboxylate-CoA ligase